MTGRPGKQHFTEAEPRIHTWVHSYSVSPNANSMPMMKSFPCNESKGGLGKQKSAKAYRQVHSVFHFDLHLSNSK